MSLRGCYTKMQSIYNLVKELPDGITTIEGHFPFSDAELEQIRSGGKVMIEPARMTFMMHSCSEFETFLNWLPGSIFIPAIVQWNSKNRLNRIIINMKQKHIHVKYSKENINIILDCDSFANRVDYILRTTEVIN